ncbi:EpaQ family protein [Enterococcus sp. LJL128]
MGKIVTKFSNLILLILLAGSYWMWIMGIVNEKVLFVYSNAAYICLAGLLLILVINFKEMTKPDWLLLALAIIVFLFYLLVSVLFNIDNQPLVIPIICLFLLGFKKIIFDAIDFTLLIGISFVSLVVILYKVYVTVSTGIPNWINSNTIGAAITFSTITIVIFLKSLNIGKMKYFLQIPIYASSLLAIWALRSDTSFLVLGIFGLLDNFFSKKFIQTLKINVFAGIFAFLSLIAPMFFYLIAQSKSTILFSGREAIWNEFFRDWLSKPRHILIGMETFKSTNYVRPQAVHNGFLFILGNYGLLGYLLLFGLFTLIIYKFWNPRILHSKRDISFLLAFFCVFIHSTMEQTFTSYQWMPIVYLFIGLTISDRQTTEKNGPHSTAEMKNSIEIGTRSSRHRR